MIALKNIIKGLSVGVFGLFLLIIIGVVALPYLLPLDKVKNYATTRLSESLHRTVTVDRITFNLFSGFKLEGLSVGDKGAGNQPPFIVADSLDLHYAFWPLFSRQIIIKEISLVNPRGRIEKNANGLFNFSDLLGGGEKPNPVPKQQTKTWANPPFNIFVDSFTLKNGLITYNDKGSNLKTDVKNINIRISGFTLALFKPVNVQASAQVLFQGKTVPLAFSTQVGLDPAKERISFDPLNFSIAGESLSGGAQLTNKESRPKIDLHLTTQKFSLDPILAIFSTPQSHPTQKTALARGELTKSVNKSLSSLPGNLAVACSLNFKDVTFQSFKVDALIANLSLANKVLTTNIKVLEFYGGKLSGRVETNLSVPGLSYSINNAKLAGFNASPFTNSLVETFLTKQPDYKDLTNKVYGLLDLSLSLQGRGIEPEDILANLVGTCSLSLKNGELKRVKTLAAIGQTLKSNSLQSDIKFGSLSSSLTINKKNLSVKNLELDRPDFSLGFTGGLDLNKSLWLAGNRLTIKVSPTLSSTLPKELSVFRDNRGWLELTFELTGSLKLPLPRPIFDKPIEAALGKVKVKIEAKKVELETQAQSEIAKKQAEATQALEAEKERLNEEAKTKIKRLLKF